MIWKSRVAAFAGVAFAFLASAAPVSADPPTLAGTWSAGPMTETVNATSWPEADCGPKPKGGGTPGGSYKVTTSGDELVFSGSPAFRTDQCTDMGLAQRVSHSATPAIRWWKTRCESPKGSVFKAAITTVVRAVDDDTIVLSETAQYSSQPTSGATCAATVERSRTFKIVAREGAAAPVATSAAPPVTAPPPSPPPSPTVSCDSVGEASTLEVKPRRKILRPGERFDFKARVLDAKGCEVAGKATFRLAPESAAIGTVAVDPNGKVEVHADAEPVVASIVVEAAGKSARVELEVVTDDKYAKLLAAGGGELDAGEDQAVAIELSSGGAAATTVRDAGTKDTSRRRFAYLAIAGGGCTLLALAALVLWRRGNAQAAAEEEARRAKKGQRASLGDARPLSPPEAPVAVASQGGASQGGARQGGSRTCPTCGASPPAEAEFCPNDGTRLTASTKLESSAAPPTAGPGGRICPVCGRKYERDARFCSKDGVELVPLN